MALIEIFVWINCSQKVNIWLILSASPWPPGSPQNADGMFLRICHPDLPIQGNILPVGLSCGSSAVADQGHLWSSSPAKLVGKFPSASTGLSDTFPWEAECTTISSGRNTQWSNFVLIIRSFKSGYCTGKGPKKSYAALIMRHSINIFNIAFL